MGRIVRFTRPGSPLPLLGSFCRCDAEPALGSFRQNDAQRSLGSFRHAMVPIAIDRSTVTIRTSGFVFTNRALAVSALYFQRDARGHRVRFADATRLQVRAAGCATALCDNPDTWVRFHKSGPLYPRCIFSGRRVDIGFVSPARLGCRCCRVGRSARRPVRIGRWRFALLPTLRRGSQLWRSAVEPRPSSVAIRALGFVSQIRPPLFPRCIFSGTAPLTSGSLCRRDSGARAVGWCRAEGETQRQKATSPRWCNIFISRDAAPPTSFDDKQKGSYRTRNM